MICGNCGKSAVRVKTLFEKEGKKLASPLDECEFCADGGKHEDPAWMRHRPIPRWESHPHEYKKTYEADGSVLMMPTDESKADLEAQVLKPATDEIIAGQRAIEHKLQTRKLKLEGSELELAMQRANRVAEACVNDWKQQVSENEEAWQQEAEQYKVQ